MDSTFKLQIILIYFYSINVTKSPMKVLILAGGLGSRLSEETTVKPKPMVEIGGKPILWHIIKIYRSSHYKSERDKAKTQRLNFSYYKRLPLLFTIIHSSHCECNEAKRITHYK